MKFDDILTRMHDGRLYHCDDPELVKEQLKYLDLVHDYNQLKPSQQEEKQALLKQMFQKIGDDCYIETPFHASWGGKHVKMGTHVYANYNLMMVDDTEITIGDHVMIGPNVVICSGTHPISPKLRIKQVQYNKPVHIGHNVWIGASCVIMPGVTIGDHSIIGAGSIVTKDVPANVIACGVPCKIIREITEEDERIYDHDQVIA